MLEKDVLSKSIRKLESYKINGLVLWYRRLANALLYSRNGTPVMVGGKKSLDDGKDLDLVIAVKCSNSRIALVFIDTKRTGVNKFSYEQQVFVDSMEGKPMILCGIVNDPKQLWPLIDKASKL